MQYNVPVAIDTRLAFDLAIRVRKKPGSEPAQAAGLSDGLFGQTQSSVQDEALRHGRGQLVTLVSEVCARYAANCHGISEL